MAIVQRLSARQIEESLDEAMQRHIPVSMTCRTGLEWHNLHSKILHRTPQSVWLEYPAEAEGFMPEISVGCPLGLSFKLKHHKHIFNAVVEAAGEFGLAGEAKMRAIRVATPQRLVRVQRRAYHRVEVPRNRSVLATFWHGGLLAAAGTKDRPLNWEGWVTNISAGGFQVRLSGRNAPDLEVGDLVGVCIDLGQEYKQVLVDARFRQQHLDERGVTYQGFQFIGLNETIQGREMLHRIAGIVCEFQRFQSPGHHGVA
jgi:hypothetical protein